MGEENGSGIVIKIGLDEPIAGRMLSYGTHVEPPEIMPATLYDMIAEAAARQIVEGNDSELRRRATKMVEASMTKLIDERLPDVLDEVLGDEIVVTEPWGDLKFKGTLRELIAKRAQEQLKVPDNSYGRSHRETVLSKVVEDQIDRALQKELTEVVTAAKANVLKKLEEKASEIMASTITSAMR